MRRLLRALHSTPPPCGFVWNSTVTLTHISQSLRDVFFHIGGFFVPRHKAKTAINLDADQQLHTDIRALPFADHTFDGVYALEASATLPDSTCAPDEIRRLLNPHGVFINATSEAVRTDISNNMEVGWEIILKRNNVER